MLRLFPELYKGKDGNQRLLRDTRYLKISCNGKIPEATADERDRLQQLIRAGKSKVAQDTGMPDDTENFLVHEENEIARLERIEDSDLLPQKATSPTTETPTTTGYANIHSSVNYNAYGRINWINISANRHVSNTTSQ